MLNKMFKSQSRNRLMTCASVAVLSATIAGHTSAQSEEETLADASLLEEIVVTGARAANRAAIAVKEDSDVIMDAFSADDIGALPELNAADTFRRMPGISTVNDSDEGQFVTIRGISAGQNFVTVDGMAIATDQENSRAVNMEAIPSTAVVALEAYKSLTPNLDANAIGGVLNMKTLSAFSHAEPYLRINASLSEYSMDQTPDDDDGLGGDLDIVYSTFFGSDDQWGLVISGKYAEKNRDEMKWDPRFDFIDVGAANGQRDAFRKRFNSANYTNIWTTNGGMIKLEYKTDDVYAYVKGFDYEKEEEEDTSIWQIERNGSYDDGDYGFYEDQAGGFSSMGKGELGFASRPTTRTNGGVHFHIDTTINDDHSVSFDIAQSDATYNRPYFKSYWKTSGNVADLGYTYDQDAVTTHPDWELNNAAYAENAGNYTFDSIKDEVTAVDDEVTEVRVDYKYTGKQWTGSAGLKFRNNTRDMNRDRTNYKWNADIGDKPTLADFVDNGVSFSPSWFNGYTMPFMDYDAFDSYYAANPDHWTTDENDIYKRGVRDDFKFDEDVTSAYAMAKYEADNWSIIGGLRYEETDVTNSGTQLDKSTNIYNPFSTNSNYDHLLPSLNLSYQITDELRLRAGISKSIGRADPGETKALSTYGLDDEGNRKISKKNEDLKAKESTNYDISLEYYFSDLDGMASLALFKKDITNDIIGVNQVEEDTHLNEDGELRDTITSQNKNGDENGMEGIEVNFVMNSLDFIPNLPESLKGFGFSVNGTWLDGYRSYEDNEGNTIKTDHLTSQATHLANAAFFYNFLDDRGEARLAYNYTGETSGGIKLEENNYSENIWGAFEQVDAQVSFLLTDKLKIQAKIRNLGDKHRPRYLGYNAEIVEHEVYFGRSMWIGGSYKF